MPDRGNQKVAVDVGKLVHRHHGAFAFEKSQFVLILQCSAEDAPAFFFAQNVLNPPRGPHGFHGIDLNLQGLRPDSNGGMPDCGKNACLGKYPLFSFQFQISRHAFNLLFLHQKLKLFLLLVK